MEIRKAKSTDLNEKVLAYEYARTFMRNNGNPMQWPGGYPGRDDAAEDRV